MSEANRQVLDVEELPHVVLDHRSPIWWGNVWMIVIETTMFAILIASYFYLRQNFTQWPPPQPNFFPPNFHPVPDLGVSTLNLLVILASCLPMWWADQSALERHDRRLRLGLIGAIALGLVAITLRAFEFHALKFRWDDNVYGSLVWTILGMHLMHLIVAVCECSLMLAWAETNGLDDKHRRDIRVTAVYWYWMAGIWILLFAIVFLGPRIL